MDMNSNGLDMSGVFGPIYWGTVISLVLGGITVLQAYRYFPHPSDRLIIRIIAGAMVAFDFASTALVVQSVYYYLVPHFGSITPLESITPELSAECLLSTIITFISQSYFVAQIYAVTKTGRGSYLVPLSVAICAILAFAFGVACTSVMFLFDRHVLGERHQHFSIFFGLAKGFGALTDIIATIAMCILLSGAKTGIQQTNSMLKSLVHFVVHRGVLVTLIQTLLLITFYAAPTHLYWLAFHVNVTKLYANTFFAMLNGRDQIKEKHTGASFTTHSKGRYVSNHHSFIPGKDMESQSHIHDDGNSYPMNAMPTVTRTIVISDL